MSQRGHWNLRPKKTLVVTYVEWLKNKERLGFLWIDHVFQNSRLFMLMAVAKLFLRKKNLLFKPNFLILVDVFYFFFKQQKQILVR